VHLVGFHYKNIIIIINVIIIDVIRGDTGTFFLENILLAFISEMCHLSDGSPCGIESSKNLCYSRILFECLNFTVAFISPQMFHGLYQESVDAVDPCDTSSKRVKVRVLEVNKEKCCFLNAIIV
jgi:hypothetical protein